jgi:hypothetical protein
MADRVRQFCEAYPSTDATYAPMVARLAERIDRMEALLGQELEGVLHAHSSVVRRKALRRRLQQELLRHLVTVARVAVSKDQGVAQLCDLPPAHLTNEALRVFARQKLEQGQARADLLARYGLAEKLLEDLAAAVDEFDETLAESNEGRRNHVGARAELKAVSDELMQLVEMLDGLNRYRFSETPEFRVAWESARRVVSGRRAVVEGDVKAA